MNASAVSRHYGRLTPEERFRLILAAGARGDEVEQDRLVNSAGTITLDTSDYAPFARAFHQLAILVFIELLEDAAQYQDFLIDASEGEDCFGPDEAEAEEGDEREEEPDAEDEPGPAEGDDDDRPLWQRELDLALVAGYMLRTKAEGWKLFCERMDIPPFAVWEGLPGFDRLQRALAGAEKAAYTPEGFLRWLNRVRPAGAPEHTESPLTVEGRASSAEDLFRKRVEWWGG
jgi:hypothetical protein